MTCQSFHAITEAVMTYLRSGGTDAPQTYFTPEILRPSRNSVLKTPRLGRSFSWLPCRSSGAIASRFRTVRSTSSQRLGQCMQDLYDV